MVYVRYMMVYSKIQLYSILVKEVLAPLEIFMLRDWEGVHAELDIVEHKKFTPILCRGSYSLHSFPERLPLHEIDLPQSWSSL